MKWYRRHRPHVHYWFWFAILAANALLAILFAWVGRHIEQSVTRPVITHLVVIVISYFCIKYWQKWIDNPDEYEKVQQARIRRVRRRLVRGNDRKKKKDNTQGPR